MWKHHAEMKVWQLPDGGHLGLWNQALLDCFETEERRALQTGPIIISSPFF